MARRWSWGLLDLGTKLPDLITRLNDRLKALEGSFNAGTAYAIETPTTAATAVTLHDVLAVDATAAPVAVTLPTARAGKGHALFVVKTDATANAVTVTPAGSDTVGAAATWALGARNEGVMLVGDGAANWLPLVMGALNTSRLVGTTLPASVVTSSLTSVGTITSGVWNAGAVTSSGGISGTTGRFSQDAEVTETLVITRAAGDPYLFFSRTGAGAQYGLIQLLAGKILNSDCALTLAAGLTATTAKLTALGAFATNDKYVVVDASGNLHVSTLGPIA